MISVNKDLSQDWLSHLRWIMQKDNLAQDVFLIGKPGSLRRTLAMSYLELTQREVEYICLSRDTTEADIKQRREIVNGTAKYYDQVMKFFFFRRKKIYIYIYTRIGICGINFVMSQRYSNYKIFAL